MSGPMSDPATPEKGPGKGPRNGRMALALIGLVMTMGALSFAAVPFYTWFCRTTGFAGTPQVAEHSTGEVLDQTISIRFDANVGGGLPWTFKPTQNQMTVKIGDTVMATYEATNNSNRPVTGSAVFNVAPDVAGAYFTKIECFCFTEQTLQPGETVSMPVVFYVDPEIKRDSDTARVHEIALSYTFYEKAAPQPQASLPPAQKPAYN